MNEQHSKDTFDEKSPYGCPECPHQQNSHVRNGDVYECWANDRCGCTVPVGQATVATFDAVKWLRDMERYERDNEFGPTFGSIADEIERLRQLVKDQAGVIQTHLKMGCGDA